MIQKTEISSLKEIKILVDAFYTKVRKDDLLKDIFETTIGDRWPEHLEKMYKFWQTVLLDEHTYYGSPFAPHATMPLSENHFQRWIALFYETLNENFNGPVADEAKIRAEKMAAMFLAKITYYRNTQNKPLL